MNDRVVLGLRVLLTEQCNLSCGFCHNEGQPVDERMLAISPMQLQALVEEAACTTRVRVKLSGGEPTLHPDFPEYLDAVRDAGAEDVAVISNGTGRRLLEAGKSSGEFRALINMPSVDAPQYRRLTGGDLHQVVENVRTLRHLGVPVAFNTYSPTSIGKRTRIRGVCDLAAELGCEVKLLLPCQIHDAARLHAANARLTGWLESEGFVYRRPIRQSRVFSRGEQIVRVVSPWCPDFCRRMHAQELTLRIAANGALRTCLSGASSPVATLRGTAAQMRAQFRQGLAAASAGCITERAQKVSLVQRRELESAG